MPVHCLVMCVDSFPLASMVDAHVALPVQQPVLASAVDLEGKSPVSVS